MSQLNGLFDWTCTYLQESEITEVHGIAQPILHTQKPSRSRKFDKHKVLLPGSNITSIIKKKKRYFLRCNSPILQMP